MKTQLFSQWLSGNLVINDQLLTTGNIYYVHSGTGTDAGGYGVSPDKPCATLDYAVGLCTANKGDIIVLMAGHSESLIAATSAVLDVAGVRVVGQGRGTLRPLLTVSTAAAATLSITAANVSVENVRLYSDYTGGITAGITVAATADGCHLKDIEMTEAANTKEWLIGISVAAACTDVVIDGLRYFSTAGGDTTSVIAAAGAADRLILRNCLIDCDASAAAVKLDAAASIFLQIVDNLLVQRDAAAGLGIAAHASSTGFARGNYICNLKDTVAGITGAALAFGDNYYSNAAGASAAILVPATDA